MVDRGGVDLLDLPPGRVADLKNKSSFEILHLVLSESLKCNLFWEHMCVSTVLHNNIILGT